MSELKTERIHIVVTPTQKATFVEAAKRDGISLSAWVLQALSRAARNEQRTGRV